VLTCRPDYRSAAGRNVRVSTAFQIYLDTRGEISRRGGNMELQIGYQSVTSHIPQYVIQTYQARWRGVRGGDEFLYLKGECYIF